MNNVALSLYSLPLYPSMSPGSPGFSRFLLSPGRASVASNIVKPGEYTYNNLYPMVQFCHNYCANEWTSKHIKNNHQKQKKIDKKKKRQSPSQNTPKLSTEMLKCSLQACN